MAFQTPPQRHWHSYGTEPLPTPAEALSEPFRAFPSWFLRITCDRCGRVSMLNEAHTRGRRGQMPLRDLLRRMRQKLAARAGHDPRTFAGHSLRSGFVTSAVEANAPLMKIAEQTRHKSLQMLQVYSRRADLFRDHAGAAFL